MKQTLLIICILIFLSYNLFAGCIADSVELQNRRETMVRDTIEKRGISDFPVLKAMRDVPRHCFVPRDTISRAYDDTALPIGEGQTISQPYIVALMTASLKLRREHRVLEIGTGSGYQSSVLAELVKEVYTIEIKKKLHTRSNRLLRDLGYTNIRTRHGDGYFGWPDAAPFDAIMITAAVNHVPPPLLKQLKDGGMLILPLGNPFRFQNLTMVIKKGDDYVTKSITGVLFVPMTGHASD